MSSGATTTASNSAFAPVVAFDHEIVIVNSVVPNLTGKLFILEQFVFAIPLKFVDDITPTLVQSGNCKFPQLVAFVNQDSGCSFVDINIFG